MKNLIILLLLPFSGFAQNMSGIWTGTLYNDSTQKATRYEIAINEKNGKFNAFSYTLFNVDGKEIYGVKSLDIIRSKDKIFFRDKDLLIDNYPPDAPKGVKQISAVQFFDSLNWKCISGTFTTTRSGKYGRPVTGKIFLTKVEDQPKEITLIKLLIKSQLTAAIQPLIGDLKEDVAVNKPPKQLPEQIKKAEEKTTPLKETLAATPLEQAVSKPQPVAPKPLTAEQALAERKIEIIRSIEFTSDSLRFELYDNGSVDGDSVTVFVNGKPVMEHQRLTGRAIQKTVYATGDSLRIVLFAENLGSIAPNTGLLIVYDGEKRYEIGFSGDLSKNSAILFRRKKINGE